MRIGMIGFGAAESQFSGVGLCPPPADPTPDFEEVSVRTSITLLAILLFAVTGTIAAPIDINHYRFEPNLTEPDIAVSLRAPVETGISTVLVQFRGPIEESWKQEVAALGARLIAYIPENAFIARMDRESRARVAGLDCVNWIGDYHVAYRISPEIGTIPFVDPARRDDPMRTLRVRVAEDLDRAVARAGTLGEVLERIEEPQAPGFAIHIAPEKIESLAALNEVLWVEEVPEAFTLNNVTRWVVQSNVDPQTPVWSHGVYGEGQIVAEMDTGLDYNSCWFRDTGNAPPGPTHRKVIDYRTWGGNVYDGCDTGHGTHVAGTCVGDQSYINPGNTGYNGMAYKARIMIQDVGSDGWLACLLGLLSVPTSLGSAFTDAYGKGARVHTNSWGSTSNAYDGYSVDVDNFMWNHKDFLCCFANGNSGPSGSTVGSPATAKNCVSVGATKQAPSQETIASYSSRGPASDGRFKPTVTAPGGEDPTFINSANNNTGNPPSATCSTQGDPFQGTSMATPAVAGCALLVRDYFAQGFYPLGAAGGDPIAPSAALVKAMLVNSGRDMGTLDQPNNTEGWGRLVLDDALYFGGDSRELRMVDESTGLATGEQVEFVVNVDSSSEPIEASLVWTDYPASQNANPALVNDLDLTLIDPLGVAYLGNVYSGGQSNPGGAADRKNVEESARRVSPPTGNWTVRVRAQNVPQGGHQPFALVITGSFGGWPEPPADVETTAPMAGLRLDPARPNPFSRATTLAFELPAATHARLATYDATGRRVALLVDGQISAGSHVREWDARGLPAGIYLCKLETAVGSITRKMTLLP